MLENKVKRKLKVGKPTVGTWVTIGSPVVSEILSRLGFDWLVFDTEHSPMSLETVQVLLQGANGTDVVPIVRVPWNDSVYIKRALDIGAYGIVVPWVNSIEDAEGVVKACRYPPRGIRGVGPIRASNYLTNLEEYFENVDEEILIIVQIETQEALNNIDEILSVDGIDACYFGPVDFSASLGIFGKWNHPRYKAAVRKVLRTAKRRGVAAGIHCLTPEDAVVRIKQGFQFVAIGLDFTLLINGCKEALKMVGVGR